MEYKYWIIPGNIPLESISQGNNGSVYHTGIKVKISNAAMHTWGNGLRNWALIRKTEPSCKSIPYRRAAKIECASKHINQNRHMKMSHYWRPAEIRSQLPTLMTTKYYPPKNVKMTKSWWDIMNGVVKAPDNATTMADTIDDGTEKPDIWRLSSQSPTKICPFAYGPWCSRSIWLHKLVPWLLFDVETWQLDALSDRTVWGTRELVSYKETTSGKFDPKPSITGPNGPHSALEQRYSYRQTNRKPTSEEISTWMQVAYASEALKELWKRVNAPKEVNTKIWRCLMPPECQVNWS